VDEETVRGKEVGDLRGDDVKTCQRKREK